MRCYGTGGWVCDWKLQQCDVTAPMVEGLTGNWFGGSSMVWRVVELRRVCCELLSKGRELVATWRTTTREWVPGLGDSRGVAWLGVVTLKERLVTAWV